MLASHELASTPDAAGQENALLRVSGLTKHFPVARGFFGRTTEKVHAVDDLSFEIRKGETLGIVGESGCGKSTAGMTILRLIEPTSGSVWFEDKEVTRLDEAELRLLRREMQIIFQNPYASLNSRMTTERIVGEPLEIHNLYTKRERRERVAYLLEKVGLRAEHATRYPHEFSSGQRQRIAIARALAMNPKLIIADEPVSALDVSIQAQVINLLEDLQKEFQLAYLFISHDLSVVEHISDRVAVMYLGQIMEIASKKELYSNPLHPYTEALFSAVPVPDPALKRDRVLLTGDVPSPIRLPSGCRFYARCPKKKDECRQEVSRLVWLSKDHAVRCPC